MTSHSFAIFDTAIGRCGIVWGARGINGVQLPMGSEDKTRTRIRQSHGDIAKRLGGVELSRDVGQALGRNPCPIVVPCHRVLAAGGKPGGFSANGGVVTKLKMLAIEGAVVNHTPSLFD